jgi:hypothetical protein
MDLSPENQEKLDRATAMMDGLSTRLDTLMARRFADAAVKAQRRADKAKAKADTHLPSEAPPPSDNPDNLLDIPPYEEPAWFPPNFMDDDFDEQRTELRQGALSKEQF